jgi:hypothetical protein
MKHVYRTLVTLCVGTPPGTLRVPLATQGFGPRNGDAQRHGMHSHAKRENERHERKEAP